MTASQSSQTTWRLIDQLFAVVRDFTHGQVRLNDGRFGRHLVVSGGTFENITGWLWRRCPSCSDMRGERVHADGQISLIGAQIGGDINLDGGCFASETGEALTAGGVQIGGNLNLGGGVRVRGPCNCSMGTCQPGLVIMDGVFSNEGNAAILADGLQARKRFCLRSQPSHSRRISSQFGERWRAVESSRRNLPQREGRCNRRSAFPSRRRRLLITNIAEPMAASKKNVRSAHMESFNFSAGTCSNAGGTAVRADEIEVRRHLHMWVRIQSRRPSALGRMRELPADRLGGRLSQ